MRKKPRVPVKKQTDKEVNARLLRTYGITLAEYDAQLAKQNGVCSICFRPPGPKRLHVDHDHGFVKRKIVSVREAPKQWRASIPGFEIIEWFGSSKTEVVGAARNFLKRASIRGILCSSCNRGLGKTKRFFNEDPKLLHGAAEYLERFHKLRYDSQSSARLDKTRENC